MSQSCDPSMLEGDTATDVIVPVGVRNLLSDHYRCPSDTVVLDIADGNKGKPGFFKVTDRGMCFGSTIGDLRTYDSPAEALAIRGLTPHGSALSFDPKEILDNLRYERYVSVRQGSRWIEEQWVRNAYYRLRPLLPVLVRKYLQQVYLKDWKSIQFPKWPVDLSADVLLEHLLLTAMKASGTDSLPFVWFWPAGFRAAAVMTHDVETTAGRDYCEVLMDLDGEFEIPASYQIVPEKRYAVPAGYLDMLRSRGAEVNIQGLDHATNLFGDRQAFLAAARRINQYATEFAARGFRSPVMYRNVDWFQELTFDYDMSVPTVARLEPQRGGCCTVMPYFLPGGMLELPLTTTEDYSLFHVLGEYSINVWREQIRHVYGAHGLISFVVHPDYVRLPRAQNVYRSLLEELANLRARDRVWIARPGEINRWWRARNEMQVVRDRGAWRVRGVGSEQAQVAYAHVDGDRLAYELDRQG